MNYSLTLSFIAIVFSPISMAVTFENADNKFLLLM